LLWDSRIYHIVTFMLGLSILGSIVVAGILRYHDKPIPKLFLAIGSGLVGALPGLLNSPSRRGDKN